MSLLLFRFQTIGTFREHIALLGSLSSMKPADLIDASTSLTVLIQQAHLIIRSLLIGSICLCFIAIASLVLVGTGNKNRDTK